MATPFDREGKLNLAGAAELAKRLAGEGTTAVVLAGTTGESPTLSDDEKLALFETVKRNVGIPVIANVGSNNTEKSALLAQKAKETGIDGIMAVVPYYNKPNREGIYQHFKTIAQAAQLPLMVYNVPGRTALNLDAETILRIAKIPFVHSIKEATEDFGKISRVIREAPPHFKVYTGEDHLTLPILAIGGYGVVSVAAHVAGRQMKAMIENYLAGRVEKAKELHLALTPVYESLFLTANPIPLKSALRLCGFDAGSLRLPLVEASGEIVARLKADLQNLSLVEGKD
jgi:4-hydroxy-tetrahydrodipicolinate synthase